MERMWQGSKIIRVSHKSDICEICQECSIRAETIWVLVRRRGEARGGGDYQLSAMCREYEPRDTWARMKDGNRYASDMMTYLLNSSC